MTDSQTNQDPVVEVAQLKKAFGDLQVLKGFTVDLRKGENLVILGRSGVGKSVLIKCIVGLMKPDSGTLRVLGADVAEMDSHALTGIRMKIGFLFQGSALYDSMTIEENLLFPLRMDKKKETKAEMHDRVMQALEEVGLPDKAESMPAELSGGMQKRIGLARALIRHPEIMLYDEPTGGLDTVTGKEISQLISDMREKFNSSSIIITHDIFCAEIAGGRIAVVEDGQCYATGTFDEISKSSDPVINKFFK